MFLGSLAAFLVVAVVAAYSLGWIKLNLGANAGICSHNEEIASQERSAIDSSALAFYRAAMAQDADAALALMIPEAQSGGRTSVMQTIALLARLGPFANATVADTYLVHSSGGGPVTRTICGTVSGDQWVAVQIRPGMTQAHVVISAQTRNNGWAFVLWMVQDQNKWRVQYFNVNTSSVAGYTPDRLLALARKERDGGHVFNASLLYAGVKSIIDRGPAFQLGIDQTVASDISELKTPVELQGTPPFNWAVGGVTYKVAQVAMIGIASKLGIGFQLPQTVWIGDADVSAKNRAFINWFITSHPDYSRVFSFLVARALEPDNSGGFGTVYENGKGFD
jgi:hypothetical protein